MSAAPRLSVVPAVRHDDPTLDESSEPIAFPTTGARQKPTKKKGTKASRRRTKPSSDFIRGIEAIERALAPDVHVRQAQERARKIGAEKTRSHVAYVEREIRSAAKVRAYSALEWTQIARALADCADKRRESLVRMIDAFAVAVLDEAMDRGLITPASFVAGCGALAAERRLTDYRHRVEAKGLRVAADLAAAVERLGMCEDTARFVAAILRIDVDVDTWGTAPIADRLVRAVGDIDPALMQVAGLHAVVIFGTARTLERYEDAEAAREKGRAS